MTDFLLWQSLALFSFFGVFLAKNEENCQNPNRLLRFLEIWYVDGSRQMKI